MDVVHQLHGKGPYIAVCYSENGSFYLLADYRTNERMKKEGNEFIARHESASCTFPAEKRIYFSCESQLVIIYWFTQLYTFRNDSVSEWVFLLFYLDGHGHMLAKWNYGVMHYRSIKNENEWTPKKITSPIHFRFHFNSHFYLNIYVYFRLFVLYEASCWTVMRLNIAPSSYVLNKCSFLFRFANQFASEWGNRKWMTTRNHSG